jgi:methylene-tetrahydromethanopterin dehydrogenase
MEKPYILHMFTPAKNLSPFDVNMALDAGWDNAVGYTNVEKDDVQALTQDAIFSRGPSGVKRTGIFLGGRDMHMAMDMMEIVQESMVPPFQVSCFADPSGAFTTAAGMVACVEQALKDKHNTDLNGKCVIVMGGTGPVGSTAAVLAAKAGASSVKILGRKKDKSQRVAALCNSEYGADLTGIEGEANDEIDAIVDKADVILACAAAGIQVITEEHIKTATGLKVAADVNAVPPSGIYGLDVMGACEPIQDSKNAFGIGALAIGNVKYQTQHRMLQEMHDREEPIFLHFERAFEIAREIVQGK